MKDKRRVVAEWSGGGWALCSGEWSLYIDGKNFTKKIPKRLRTSPMYTLGEYSQWRWGDDGEEWYTITDGLSKTAWITENENWLSKITDDFYLWAEIYDAFQERDFRTNQCGGCI